MDLPDLFFNIQSLHPFPLRLPALLQLAVITRRRLLPPRGLLLTNDRLARHPVEDIATLAGKPLEVGRHVRRRQVGRALSEVRLRPLFLPPRVEQFD